MFYNNVLVCIIIIDLIVKEIYIIGLVEVVCIYDEMCVIKDKVGFEGDFKVFM